MRVGRLVMLLAVTVVVSAEIPPYVSEVVDAASYTDGIAPGAVFVVKGYALPIVYGGLRTCLLYTSDAADE